MGFTNNAWAGTKRFAKIMGLKEKNPHFLVGTKENWQPFTECEWDFQEITFKDITRTDEKGEHERRVFDLVLTDAGEELHINSWFTSVGRNLLNCLINCKPQRIKLSLYVNKAGYPSIAFYNNNEMIGWKLSWDEQQELTEVTELKGGRKDIFRGELEKKLEEEALKLNEAKAEKELAKEVDDPKSWEDDETDKDLLPF